MLVIASKKRKLLWCLEYCSGIQIA